MQIVTPTQVDCERAADVGDHRLVWPANFAEIRDVALRQIFVWRGCRKRLTNQAGVHQRRKACADAVVVLNDRRSGCSAQRRSTFDDSIESGSDVAGVGADESKHLARRDLQLKRFVEVIEELRIRYRDHGLVGERSQNSHFMLVERVDVEP